jgi:hypothetical protein
MMLVHQFLAVIASPCAFLLAAMLTQALRLNIAFAGVVVVLSWLAGFPCGYYFPKSETSRTPASFAWVVPVAIYALLFISESRDFGFSKAVAAFFSLNPSDDESLATVLFTLPTCSALTYSLGAFTRARLAWRRARV